MTIDPSRGEFILYRTQDGRAAIRLRVVDGTIWLTQAEVAALFDTTPQNVTHHLRTCERSTTTANWTNRQLVRISYKFTRRAAGRSGARLRPTISTPFSRSVKDDDS